MTANIIIDKRGTLPTWLYEMAFHMGYNDQSLQTCLISTKATKMESVFSKGNRGGGATSLVLFR